MPASPIADADSDHAKQRSKWFLHGRLVPGKSSPELRLRAYRSKMQARAVARARARGALPNVASPASLGGWTPLGPAPLASDASGDGFQDYHQVAGRATAVAIDPADPTGNTVYIGGAQSGVWKSTNAAAGTADNITWTPITDDQATLAIGSIAIQPGNSVSANSVILAGTGEANDSPDSYFGLGILHSNDGGNTWSLVSEANGGALSFGGLGAARMAFSTASVNTVVAAMGATPEGVTEGAVNSNTFRGLYTSTDAGQSWTYDALFPGAPEATSATSVVYNAAAGLYFAVLRYHGFYSSTDGLNWTRLANQPGASGLLSPTSCPPSYLTSCPIYRGEITVVPGRNEMYTWFISLDSNGSPVDQGIWQSVNGGGSWTQISDSGIINCGDVEGCGVEQGFSNLALLAVPNCPDGVSTCTGNPTDLYAGAVNLYKCSITSINQDCSDAPFINLTHVYGCDPLGALAHVHPGQHALAFSIPNSGSSSASDLMYFANDGGIYRALNGFTGLTTGSCSGMNEFDDLNQNLGSMTQFVSFSQDPANQNLIFGGTQDNGSAATATATTNPSWGNVLGGDGGYTAIDSVTGKWYASNPDTGLGTLNIQECSSGVNCNDSLFDVVVGSSNVGGDDGGFDFPYILDPQSTTWLLVGTCRVWRGSRSGGAFTLLSLNFDTLGIGTCAGTEVNVVRSLAAGGPTNANGSQVIYATTDGPGPNDLSTPTGGNVWLTTNAAAVSGIASTFANVTLNGPGGSSINPNQFPISSVAIDTSDGSGNTAYVTVMGFTGGPGHVWQTRDAGASWIDFSGAGLSAIPDSPANAVVVDPVAQIVYVGTDVGVFESPTSAATWTEVGPIPNTMGGSTAFLPNVAVTALALFDSGGTKLLRASTYGRGVWQFNSVFVSDFEISVSNTPLTVFEGGSAIFNGSLTAVNGYNNLVTLSCSGASLPTACSPDPISLIPSSIGTAFSISAGASAVADYDFNLQGAGSDSNHTTHVIPLTLHVVDVVLSTPSPNSVTVSRGATSPAVSFEVAAQGTFDESVTVSCSINPSITGATCSFTPSTAITLTSASPVNMTATVTIPAGTPTGNYAVTLQATSSEGPAPSTASFNVTVTANPDFVLSEPSSFPTVNAGSTNTSGAISIASQDGFSGAVALACSLAAGSGSCSVSPALVSLGLVNPGSASSLPASANVTVNATGLAAGATQLTVQGISGAEAQALVVPFNVGDYSIAGPHTLAAAPASQVRASLSLASTLYSGQINATCDATALPAAQCSLNPSSVTLAGGTTVTTTVSINVPNDASTGTYNININTLDMSGEPSHAWTIALTVGQDFTLSSLTPPSQTITPGEAANYNFSVLPVGASFSNPVSLSCSGGPAISQCSFTPGTVTPGNGSAAVVMNITTTFSPASAFSRWGGMSTMFYSLWLGLPFTIFATWRGRRHNNSSVPVSLLGLFLLGLFLASCGGGAINSTSNLGGQENTQPGTYSITVTGASGSLSHQAPPVTLIVNQ